MRDGLYAISSERLYSPTLLAKGLFVIAGRPYLYLGNISNLGRNPKMNNSILKSALALSIGMGLLGAAHAQTYQYKSYAPGIKSTAGFLNANKNNAPGAVKDGVFSMPTTQLNFPGAIRGAAQELAVEVFAVGGTVTANSVRTTQFSGNAPISVIQTDCEGKVMADGEKCTIVLAVDNDNGRGSNNGQVHIDGTDSKGVAITAAASLSWFVDAPQARIVGPALAFSDTEAGTVSAPKFFQVYAFGPAPLTIQNVANTTNFRVNSISCLTEQGTQSSFPVTLRTQSSGDFCDIGVVFAPTAPVAANESMVLVDDDEVLNEPITLTGNGTAAKSYAVLWNRGKQSNSTLEFTDSLGFQKTGSWNNYARYVGSKLLSSGKYYVEIQNSLGLMHFGLTQGNNTYVTAASDKVFSPASATITDTSNLGMLIDLDARTLQAVDGACAIVGPTIALDPAVAYAPSLYAHFNSATGNSVRVNFGQYGTRCNMPGFQNGWFTLQ